MAGNPRHDPNQNDLSFIKCPLCDKDMVDGLWHQCKNVLQSDEFVNKGKGIRLLWHPDFGWRSYDYPEGDVIEDLSFSDVFNWVMSDREFVPVGGWQNPKTVKNIY